MEAFVPGLSFVVEEAFVSWEVDSEMLFVVEEAFVS